MGRARRALWARMAAWLVLYFASLLTYHLAFDRVSHWTVYRLQIVPSSALLERIAPPARAVRMPTALWFDGVTVDIRKGCDGVEVWLMMAAALFVFPAPYCRRLTGLAWGTALVYALNLARVVSLALITRRYPEWFDLAHGIIWQTVIVAAAALFTILWLKVLDQNTDARTV